MMSKARDLASRLIKVDTASDALLRLDARLRLIWIEFQDGRHHAARLEAIAAIREANGLDDLGRESRARSLYAHILAEDLETASATDQALRALQLARAAGDPVSMSAALIVPAIICSRLGLFDVAVELAEKAVVQAQLSGDGLVSRIGGEEFSILLPAQPVAAPRETCEKIRAAIGSYPWGDLAEGLSVTLTIGIAVSEESHDAARCLSLADERLYIGKALGRNCVVCLTAGERPVGLSVAHP